MFDDCAAILVAFFFKLGDLFLGAVFLMG